MEAQPVESIGWYEAHPQSTNLQEIPSDPLPYQDPSLQSSYGQYAPPPPHSYDPSVPPPQHHHHLALHAPPPQHHHLAFQPPPLSMIPPTPRPRVYEYWPEQYVPEGYGYPRYGPGPRYPDSGPGPSYIFGGGEGPGYHPREAIRVFGGHPYGYPEHGHPRYPRYPMERNMVRHSEGGGFNQKRIIRKPGKVVKPAYCELCKVECNSEDAFSCHMAGKRHSRNLEKLKEKYTPRPFKSSQEYPMEEPQVGFAKSAEEYLTKEEPLVEPTNGGAIGEAAGGDNITAQEFSTNEEPQADEDVSAAVFEPKNRPPTLMETVNVEAEKQDLPEGGAAEESIKNIADNPEGSAFSQKRFLRRPGKMAKPAYCEICRVECNSEDAFACHMSGRKHAKKLEKILEKYTPKNSKYLQKSPSREPSVGDDVSVTPFSKPRKRPLSPIDSQDLEAKKRRLLQDGAAADAVRVCALCNVVCNSEIVYKFHLAGQKHAAMVKMQANPNPTEGNE
ncbi:uncharacterized protein LOC144712524 isoform X2 [Wolffia australiana]